jgi:hypothetical protein
VVLTIALTPVRTNQHFLTFPVSLKALARKLSEVLVMNQHREIQPLDYPRTIRDYGGVDELVNNAFGFIHPSILFLRDTQIIIDM